MGRGRGAAAVGTDLSVARIHDVLDARDRERGLGDGRCDDDLARAARRRRERAFLRFARERGVQRAHERGARRRAARALELRRDHVRERLDLLLPGQEREDVPAEGLLVMQLHYGAERRVDVVVLRLERVKHLDGVLPPGHSHARHRRVEEAFEQRDIERRAHHDDTQRRRALGRVAGHRSTTLRAQHEPAEDVGLQRTLVRLVDDEHRVP